MVTTKCLNGELAVDDLVLSTGRSDFAYLVGRVLEIHLLGTPEHDTGNEEHDIVVDFNDCYYPGARQREIEQMFTDLFRQPMAMEEIPMDFAIMQPSELLKISSLPDGQLDHLLQSEEHARQYCVARGYYEVEIP